MEEELIVTLLPSVQETIIQPLHQEVANFLAFVPNFLFLGSFCTQFVMLLMNISLKIAGMEKFRPSLRTMAPVPFQGPPTYFHPHIPQHTFPYSAYG